MTIPSIFLSLVMTLTLVACGVGGADSTAATLNPQQGTATTLASSSPFAVDDNAAGKVGMNGTGGNPANATVPLQAWKWIVTNLGTLPGDERSVANAINNAGQITGYAITDAVLRQHPFIYQNGRMEPMLLPVQDRSINPALINNSGFIAGYTYFPQGRDPGQAFLYANGTFATMGMAAGANGLNDEGKLVGNQTIWTLDQGRPTGVRRSAFLYYQGTLTDLTATLGIGSANGINQQGDIAGATTAMQACVYRNGQMVTIGALPGDRFSRAIGINAAGAVVGESFDQEDAGAFSLSALQFSQPPQIVPRAFLYAGGQLVDLNSQAKYAMSRAWAINAAGQVLGEAWVGQDRFSFLYQNGRFLNLSVLPELKGAGWTRVFLRALNDRGQLVGSGIINGQERALLLSPAVPGNPK